MCVAVGFDPLVLMPRPQVHRKTLNPVFNETFQFGVPLNELHSRKLHFSVYDFDRFSRHDLIGQVVVDNLLDFSEGSGDKPIWRDIVEGTAVRGVRQGPPDWLLDVPLGSAATIRRHCRQKSIIKTVHSRKLSCFPDGVRRRASSRRQLRQLDIVYFNIVM